MAQRLDRARHRRADADALRALASHPCGPSCIIGKSVAPRDGRYRYPDGTGISCAALVGTIALPPLSPSGRNVRARPDLYVRAAAPAAGWPDARWLAAVALDHADQSGDRRHRGGADLLHRSQGLPPRAPADHAAGGRGWRVAVLCPAPVRGDGVGGRDLLEPA